MIVELMLRAALPAVIERHLAGFARSRAAALLATAWGLSEATFFFLVPDILLSVLALQSLRGAILASCLSLAGAVAGGIAMYAFGYTSPARARKFLSRVPGIKPPLVASVGAQLDANGLLALLWGPAKGIPYKIYAVEWGARRGSLLGFILISLPARWIRFALACVATSALMRLIGPATQRRVELELSVVGAFWLIVYSLYFWHVGW
jgi:membrane protein YqaA with SNARE-associated domain